MKGAVVIPPFPPVASLEHISPILPLPPSTLRSILRNSLSSQRFPVSLCARGMPLKMSLSKAPPQRLLSCALM